MSNTIFERIVSQTNNKKGIATGRVVTSINETAEGERTVVITNQEGFHIGGRTHFTEHGQIKMSMDDLQSMIDSLEAAKVAMQEGA